MNIDILREPIKCKRRPTVNRGFDTGDALLAAIGLGTGEKENLKRDQLRYMCKIAPYELVQVRRKWSMKRQYTELNVADMDLTKASKD